MRGDEATMSGALAMQHRRILEGLCTTPAFDEVLGGLAPEAREAYLTADPLSWIRVEIAEDVFTRAARQLGRDPAELHEAVSREAVSQTLRTLWRFVLRLVSDEALIARAERIYARAFQLGSLSAHILEPGRAEIRVNDWPDMPEFSLRGLRIAIETVLQLSGREGARLTLHRAHSGPMFIATWRV